MPPNDMGDLAGKWRPSALSEFLRDPAKIHPNGRMPSFKLNQDESDALANYLLSKWGPAPSQASPAQLGEVLTLSNCAACHAIEGVKRCTVVLDLATTMDDDGFERAVSAAASLVTGAVLTGLNTRLVALDTDLRGQISSFQRALLCDIRVAADDARFMLPELAHGIIPDTGGVARLYQICGPGVASDMVLTGRVMSAAEALAHGVVSRVVAPELLDQTVREMAEKIASAPAVSVKMARRIISHLGEPQVRSSMAEELIAQTFINRSDDYAELRAARAQDRQPNYTGS